MKQQQDALFLKEVQAAPIIAAIKDDVGLQEVLQSQARIVFVLYGSILQIGSIVQQLKAANRLVFVHADLIEGLASKEISVNYLAEQTETDGILSTRVAIIKRAQELGLIAIQRFFLLDSMSLQNLKKQPRKTAAVDIMPGVMPQLIASLASEISVPIIASGLISTQVEVDAALSAGAVAVSTTASLLWSAG